MSNIDLEDDELRIEEPRYREYRTKTWDRLNAAGRTLPLAAPLLWLFAFILLAVTCPGGIGIEGCVFFAFVVMVLGCIGLVVPRFLRQHYRLLAGEGFLVLRSSLGTLELDPDDVQGIVGTSGVKFSVTESATWKQVVLLVGGKRYNLSFEPLVNERCYQHLRDICGHAWGIPFLGKLEAPLAGPELEPEQYVDALRQVRRFYLRYLTQLIFAGLLIICASLIGIFAMMVNGLRAPKAYVFAGIGGFIGIVITVRAFQQIPVLLSIRTTERRLSQTL